MFCVYIYINCKYLNSVIWILKNDVRCSIVLEKFILKKYSYLKGFEYYLSCYVNKVLVIC